MGPVGVTVPVGETALALQLPEPVEELDAATSDELPGALTHAPVAAIVPAGLPGQFPDENVDTVTLQLAPVGGLQLHAVQSRVSSSPVNDRCFTVYGAPGQATSPT